LRTGTSNSQSGKAELQSESVLEMLKMTSGHAKRNVIKLRSVIVSAESCMTIPEPKTPPTAKQEAHENKLGASTIKGQSLSNQSSAIQKIAFEIESLRKYKAVYGHERLLKAKIENMEKLLQLGIINQREMKQQQEFMEQQLKVQIHMAWKSWSGPASKCYSSRYSTGAKCKTIYVQGLKIQPRR
jgi:hypothetical protein